MESNVLSGKTALITGSARGLGKMSAIALANMGCNIAINYMQSFTEATVLQAQIDSIGVRSIIIQGNVALAEDVKMMARKVDQTLGSIDILINNAGPFIRERKHFVDYDDEEIDFMMQGNLLGVIRMDRYVLPAMRQRGWGRIVHFGFGRSSEARGWPHRAVYAAAKVGLVSFTKSLAIEEAPHGVTVNMVCPGDIKGAYKEKSIEAAQADSDPESPVGRPGTGEDVARVVAFLCHPSSDYVTGNIIDVSGGLDPIRNQIHHIEKTKA